MSGANSIVVETLAIRRSVAGELEGLEVDGLSPGINVVFGPNASGKSTLANLIQTLLWPDGSRREEASMTGRIRVGDSAWRIEYDGGRVLRRAEEEHGEWPQMPPASSRDRYQLCLHDLLDSDGASFAQFILRESVGGFDVDEAAHTLDFGMPTLRVRKATRQVEGARKEWEEARGEQRELRRRDKKLDEWKRRLDEAEEAARRAEAVARTVEFLELEGEVAELEAEVGAFPDAMERVRGDEVEVLEAARKAVREADGDLRDAQRRIGEVEEALEGMGGDEQRRRPRSATADSAPRRGRELGEYVERLEAVERKLRERRREVGEQKERSQRLWRRLGGRIDAESAPELDADAVDEVLALVRAAEGLVGRRRAREELEELIGDAEAPETLDEMRRGIALLGSWLSSPDADTDDQGSGVVQWVALISAIGLVAMGAVAAMAVHPAAVVLLVFAAAAAWIFWTLRTTGGESERRSVYRRDFERIAVGPPASWSKEAVEQRLRELVDQWACASLEAEKARWWRERRADRSLEALEREINEKRRQLETQTGVAVDDTASAYVIAEQIHRWQVARDELAALKARIEALEKEGDELCAKLNSGLESMGYAPVDDATEAKARVDALNEAMHEFEVQSERLETACRDRRVAEEKKETAEARRREVFERLGVGDEAEVKELCGQKDAYQASSRELRVKQRQLEAKKAELSSLEAFSEELLEGSVESLEVEKERLRQRAEKRDDILRKIQAIRTKIEEAKESVDAERKWAAYRRRRDVLRRQRRRDVGRAVGAAIAEYVREESRERSRPKVFRRARELFGAITRGRYELDLVDDDREPRFVAFDERYHVERELDELSSGTRVQLLVALRVAFVECVERGAKVPLVLDEALANSDDVRAQAIVEAVERIAGEGRQIFYFTAQTDEVRTWEALIDGSEVDGTVVDLGALVDGSTGGEQKERYGSEVAPPEHEPVPEPGEMSHREYGHTLGVDGGISPWTPVGNIHLWVIVEELTVLHRLLTEGISRWGQLRNLARHGGLDAVGLSHHDYAVLRARVDALEALSKARAVGRGRPVDRRLIEESGAVSETFIDEVDALCGQVDGEAAQLVEALERGEVKRFRSAKIEELRQFLHKRGHLDDEAPLSREAIWLRVKAAVSEPIAEGRMTDADLRRLVRRAIAGASKTAKASKD